VATEDVTFFEEGGMTTIAFADATLFAGTPLDRQGENRDIQVGHVEVYECRPATTTETGQSSVAGGPDPLLGLCAH
jgi:hypothetical protein